MKKAISFSLFGNHDIYKVGLLENIKLANEIYCDYDIHIYYDDSINIDLLSVSSGKVVFHHVGDTKVPGYFWRFFLMDDKSYDIVLSRDLDSRLSVREKVAVDHWIKSGKALHVMRDHPLHHFRIMAGMWGIRTQMLGFNITDSIKAFSETCVVLHTKNADQLYLQQIIFPQLQNDAVVHDNWLRCDNAVRFPTDRIDSQFVGEIYTQFNVPKYFYPEVFL